MPELNLNTARAAYCFSQTLAEPSKEQHFCFEFRFRRIIATHRITISPWLNTFGSLMLTIQDYQQARLTRDPRFDGRFFVAVKSTGIFCRPICPAKLPHEVNVEYFTLAQQAMLAGYRPCLRCRPDSAPHSHAWNGVDTTVNRALRILGENLHLSMTTIAEKLGISDRYLRQLFIQHIGLSPKQYQVYEQILFAKQLLQHTQLPIEHVADAAGFQ